jgi:hypothetical protein
MRQVGIGAPELWSENLTGVQESVTIGEKNCTKLTFTLSNPGAATHLTIAPISGSHPSTAYFNEIDVE